MNFVRHIDIFARVNFFVQSLFSTGSLRTGCRFHIAAPRAACNHNLILHCCVSFLHKQKKKNNFRSQGKCSLRMDAETVPFSRTLFVSSHSNKFSICELHHWTWTRKLIVFSCFPLLTHRNRLFPFYFFFLLFRNEIILSNSIVVQMKYDYWGIFLDSSIRKKENEKNKNKLIFKAYETGVEIFGK